MAASVFSFGKEQFNRIFPFYVLINSSSEIVSFGASIAKMYPLKVNDSFKSIFEIKLPRINLNGFDSLRALSGQPVVLNFWLKPIRIPFRP